MVLQQACEQLRIWQQHCTDDLGISVNLATPQFAYPHLLEDIDRTLRETGVASSSLRLEITESVLMENAQTAIAIIQELRSRHIQISIDDFGTGYSSLSYLHRFPVDSLKIDQSFIREIGPNGKNSAIAQAIVRLGHVLGMTIIAEGTETPEHLEQLRQFGCEYGQGYLFGPPLSAEEATALLATAPQW